MTRFLSEALTAPEPLFRLGLSRLEAASGHPNTDIRLSTEIIHGSQAKLRALGLDPHDTTPEELYQALQQRVALDDARLTKQLRTIAASHVSAEADVVAGMIHVLKQLPDSKRCFAIKNSSLKALFKQLPPKKAMKRLGYRSQDSLIKRETPLSIMAAAWLTEGSSWQKHLIEQYKKLKPSDFESRQISFFYPSSKRWQDLASNALDHDKHNLLSFKELGALVLLPLPLDDTTPPGVVTASLSLSLHALNEIRASSAFLKLSQVQPNFGQLVQNIATDEPKLNSTLLDRPVPWNLIQRYYHRLDDNALSSIFEPHLEHQDMVYYPIEETISKIEPSLSFWKDTAHLCILEGQKAISFNLIDVALNYCNKLPFEQRVRHYFQASLWHELLLRYMQHQPVEQSVLGELQPALALEAAQ